MPSWPRSVPVHSCSPHGISDAVLRFESDQGYSIRRSRYSRNRRLYQVTYFSHTNDLLTIMDFVEREIRGGAVTFDWTYPYPQAVASINSATPNILQTSWIHGVQTNDWIEISNSAAHNGRYQVTRVSFTGLALNGTAGGLAEGAGSKVAVHLPYAALLLDNDQLPAPEMMHGFNSFRDDVGLGRFTVTIREEFA